MAFEAVYRGPKGKKIPAEPKVTTSIAIPVSVYLEVKNRHLNISQLAVTALRAAIQEDDLTPEQAVAQMVRERDAKIEAVVQKAIQLEDDSRDASLVELQSEYNKYLAGDGFKPVDARLTWVKARKTAFRGLDGMEAQAILDELDGKA
jgi:hypothetical protein